MNILTAKSPGLNKDQLSIFKQGADLIAHDAHHSAGLWYSKVPSYGDRTVGTIGACQLNESHDPATFLNTCSELLHSDYKCNAIIGPMNGNTWFKHRLILESSDRPSFLMEPIEPAFFHSEFERAGFSILSTYCSQTIDLTQNFSNSSSLIKRFAAKGITLRSISTKQFEQDLRAIFQLSLSSFKDNFLYTPISEEAFIVKYLESKKYIDPELVLMAECNGKLIAYLFCIPDLNAQVNHQKDTIILKTLASTRNKSHAGIGSLLVNQAHATAKKKGYKEAIHALQHEDNTSTKISARYQSSIFRRYGLMLKIY